MVKELPVLGIDAGGTQLRVACRRGNVLTQPSENFLTCGPEKFLRLLQAASRLVVREEGLRPRDVRAVCLGGAGLGRLKQRRSVERLLQRVWPKAQVQVTDDATLCLTAAFRNGPGVVLLAGTGSICLGRDKNGALVRAGGWGPAGGDPGSAFAVGLAALRSLFAARNGMSKEPAFTRQLYRALQVSKPSQLEEVTAHLLARSVALLAPIVFRHAQRGDPFALRIVRNEARRLAHFACCVLTRMKGQRYALRFAGGMFRSRLYTRLVKEALGKRYEGLQSAVLKTQPVFGALFLAQQTLSEAEKG